MRVTFHGVRGSIATPGLSTVRYGGNTVCVDVRLPDGTVVVLDAGTGIRELGRVLLREEHKTPIHSLITHAHWDHIIGIPVLRSHLAQRPHIILYPLATIAQERLRHNSILFDRNPLPRSRRRHPRQDRAHRPTEERWRIGSAVISRIQLNHPGGAQGFRIDDCRRRLDVLPDRQRARTSRAARDLACGSRQVRAQRRACSFTMRSTSKPTCRRSTAGDIRWSARFSSWRALPKRPRSRSFTTSRSETTKRSIASASAQASGSKSKAAPPRPSWPARVSPSPWCRASSSLDLEQLDVEHQHARRRARARVVAVGERLRESRSASSRLRPSAARLRSSPVMTPSSGKVAGSPRVDRAVEHLAVGGPAGVVHRRPGLLALRVSRAGARLSAPCRPGRSRSSSRRRAPP